MTEYPTGAKFWYINGKRHRTDGPAIEYPTGSKHWYINGKLHRTDGPAVVRVDGTNGWCLNGIQVTMEDVLTEQEAFWWRMKHE